VSVQRDHTVRPGGPTLIERIGRYTVTRKIGEGGMGVVYAAHDPRLDRTVAIKTVRGAGDDSARQRLWREARAAAKISHPNICQLYEIDEEEGVVFLTMELLEGESLGDKIARGPSPLEDCVVTTLSILRALESLHAQGVVHRDLKPNNVFLTPVGVKLLDFGLARPMTFAGPIDTQITQVGTLVGTPRYMAPELWREEEFGAPADLFAVGAILYEMLTGRPAFEGESLLQIYENVLVREPAPLGGGAAAARIDQVIQRALRKKPEERFPNAAAMAQALEAVRSNDDSGERIAPRRMVRLLGLPLRILRADAETDFLAFALPDAVTSSLSGLGSLAVRSSATAARFADETLDLVRIAKEAEVDVVLSGTLMRSGDQLRVSAQLLQAPAGTVAWSQTFQTPIQDLFELQDALTQQIVNSLAVPLSGAERTALRHDAPASPRAYEYYLRANQVAYNAQHWETAGELYRKCLELDPQYAPAWARLGRVYRAISIYKGSGYEENYAKAREAFERALELNPDLSIAHNLYSYLEIELGQSQEAMLRLLERARSRMHDPELFAGLVQALRYCGLLDEAIAAYERAHRLDPSVRTSVSHAYFMVHDYERAIETCLEVPPLVTIQAKILQGKDAEVIEMLRKLEAGNLPRLLQYFLSGTRSILEGNLDEARPMADRILEDWRSRDPCGVYYVTRHLARAGNTTAALANLRRSVEDGFFVPSFLATDPWLDGIRSEPEFADILALAEKRHATARAAFLAAGGNRILGV
jgi:non-specific serine/threonine protein kinase